MKKTKILFYCFLFMAPILLHARNKAMLIEQMEGKTITRESFEKSGSRTGKQVFIAEKMTPSGSSFFLNINTQVYAGSREGSISLHNKLSGGGSYYHL